MTVVRFYEPYLEPPVITYSVICAGFNGKWLFVRHHLRSTFEIPGGHVEEGETPDEAAARELMEETGAMSFSIHCISTYSVTKGGTTGWGRLYLADVTEIGPVPDISEIAEVIMAEDLPPENTHPDIQPLLYKKCLEFISSRASGAK